MNIEFEELTHENLSIAIKINRSDIPEEIYKEFGPRSIALGCHKDNIRAAKFYQNHGFQRTGLYEGNDEYYLRLLE